MSDAEISSLREKVDRVEREADNGRKHLHERVNQTEQRFSDLQKEVTEMGATTRLFMQESIRRHEEAREDSREHRDKMREELGGLSLGVENINATNTELLKILAAGNSPSFLKWMMAIIGTIVTALIAFLNNLIPGIDP